MLLRRKRIFTSLATALVFQVRGMSTLSYKTDTLQVTSANLVLMRAVVTPAMRMNVVDVGIAGASGGSSGGTHRRPVKEKSPPKRTTSAKRKGKVQGRGAKVQDQNSEEAWLSMFLQNGCKNPSGATTVTYYPQHNHGLVRSI